MAKFLDDNGLLYFWQKIKNAFVAKESGKGLSSNDYTTAEKTKLAGIEGGAKANVQSDWTETDSAADAYIQHKPTRLTDFTNDGNFVRDAAYGHTDKNFTATYETKLKGVAAGAQVNVIETVKVNGAALNVSGKAVDVTVPTKVGELQNDAGYLTSHQDLSGKADRATSLAGYGITDAYTKTEVDGKLSSAFKPQGSTTFAKLPSPAKGNLGYVYNVSDAFTTTASFLEGAGKTYPGGSNVVVVESGGKYLFDVQGGFYDLTPYAKSADINSITNAEIDTVVAS